MTFGFHPEAEAEFEEAVASYEDHAEGLGLDFAAEVRDAKERALAMPLATKGILPWRKRGLPNGANLSVMMANSLPFKGRVGVGTG